MGHSWRKHRLSRFYAITDGVVGWAACKGVAQRLYRRTGTTRWQARSCVHAKHMTPFYGAGTLCQLPREDCAESRERQSFRLPLCPLPLYGARYGTTRGILWLALGGTRLVDSATLHALDMLSMQIYKQTIGKSWDARPPPQIVAPLLQMVAPLMQCPFVLAAIFGKKCRRVERFAYSTMALDPRQNLRTI